MSNVSHYLLFDRISIQQANSISSPLTYGFPALTGFLGAIHALNRKLNYNGIEFNGTLVACHYCNVQGYRPHQYADYSFNQSRNPVKKNGDTASIIEEGKAHLKVSLVVEISTNSLIAVRELRDNSADFVKHCKETLMHQRIAGGSVHDIQDVKLFNSSDASDITHELFPAFVLMDASSDLIAITNELKESNPSATALDALIETATIHHRPNTPQSDAPDWTNQNVKTGRGWLVPIPVGFQTISPKFASGELEHSRNPEYPSQYVESVYSLGKWVFPNRLPEQFANCFWRYNHPNDNLYLITQMVLNQQGDDL